MSEKTIRIDFDAVKRVALSQAESLLREWLPNGKRSGGEYVALNPTRADSKPGSFSINVHSGVWQDFATNDKGGDLISLYAYLFTGNDQGRAGRDLSERLGIAGQDKAAPVSAPKPDKRKCAWVAVHPVPEHAPEPHKAHIKRGMPEAVWCYRDQLGRVNGYVYRFRTSDGGKEVLPHVWALNAETGQQEWRWLAFTQPRPLYGLERLDGRPVLLTEGEKCADAVNEHLPLFAGLTWPGGSKAIDKVDWSPLQNREVIIWPDNDEPGREAAAKIAEKLRKLAKSVRVLVVPDAELKPGGWDIADAVVEGLTGEALTAFVQANAQADKPEQKTKPERSGLHAELIFKRGEVVSCLANICHILREDERWRGVIALDEFALRTMKLKAPPFVNGEPGEWESIDDSRTAIWLQQHYDMQPSSAAVSEAIEVLAHDNRFHPVRQWLDGLVWDGEPRLGMWLCDFVGVARSPYVMRVGAWVLMGMVARVFEPGRKFDYCLVLEGTQGRRKSSLLAAIAGPWFGDTDINLDNKDSMSALRGKWLYEFQEMGSLARHEATKQKSFISRQIDEYRPVYGRREIRCPRQVVFAGTTNEWEWNKDPTGGRRFWPIECAADIDVDGFKAVRDQLFAEALARYRRGDRFWPTSDEQRELFDPEQLRREQQESLIDALHDWVYRQHPTPFSIAHAMSDGLKIDPAKFTRDLQTRVGTALRKLGCERFEKRNGMTRYWYRPPKPPFLPSDDESVEF